ncbi:phage antirepressor KilAC domain-containing protein, partial [Bacillus albus]|uniref:phage antirepressor KilAC domain-containing protein n=1 Tax=Bacillus albus TaxID=2026189 RepID=UPI001A91A117
NIEENTATEVKTYEIDYEQQLNLAIGQAYSEGDFVAFAKATKELNDYKNRHIIEKANKYDNFLDQDGLATLTTVGKQFLGGMSARKLKAQLQNKGVLHKKAIDGTHPPRQGYESYFKLAPYNNSYGVTWNVKVTHEGIDFIVELLGK